MEIIMSYRIITKASLIITNAAGVKTEREVAARAYPAPKRDAAGSITIDGVSATYKRTGGKGRGTSDNRYMYAQVKQTSAFWPITEAEAAALVGGVATLTSVAEPVAAAPAEQPKAEQPKALRRVKAHA